MNLNFISSIYLPLGLAFSFLVSFLYLRRYPKEDVKFAYYFSIFVFGLVIFNIFLVPYDIAVAGYIQKNNITNFTLFENLNIYYMIFGFFSQIVGDVVSPIMILIEISGFYNKGEITIEVLKSYFSDFFQLIKLIAVLLASIPTTINLFIQGKDIMELLRIILLYLNFFPYLEILYYIGFVSQDLVYSVLKKKYKDEWRYFDLWKLGKIYKYYFREREIVNKRFEEINNDINEAINTYHMEIPAVFMDHYERFKEKVEETQKNLLFLVSEKKSVFDATMKHKEDEMRKNEKLKFDENFYKEMFQYVDKEEKTVKKQVALDKSYQLDDSMSNLNESDFDFSEDGDDYDEFEGMTEEELKAQLGSDYEAMMEKRNKKLKAKQNKDYIAPIHIEEKLIITEKKFQTFDNLRKYICQKMTKVIKASNSVQRKSHLISQKGIILLDVNNYLNTYTNCRLVPVAIYFCILIFFELPVNIYGFFPSIIQGFIFDLVFGIITTSFYFFIFNYATINHKYISGNLIFGKHRSSNFNFYKFISFILCYSDALFFHSVWVMKKNKDEYRNDVKYFEVFNLPEVLFQDIDIIPILSLIIIIICCFNAAKFSVIKLKIKKFNFVKVLFLFNENADFFYNESNLFNNFILGCGVLFCIKKNMDRILQILGEII